MWHQLIELNLNQNCVSFDDLYAVLVKMKKERIDKDAVYKILEDLKESNFPEKQDDLILEMMDIVTGFCSPHLRIWD